MTIITRTARFLASEDRWLQKQLQSGYRTCLWGALRKAGNMGVDEAVMDREDVMAASRIISGIIEEQYPERYQAGNHEDRIIQFNDHDNTAFADVRIILEKALAEESA